MFRVLNNLIDRKSKIQLTKQVDQLGFFWKMKVEDFKFSFLNIRGRFILKQCENVYKSLSLCRGVMVIYMIIPEN